MDKLNLTQRAAAEQFGRQSANYGKSHILADTKDIDAILGPLELPKGTPVLDVATGGGHTALYLAKRGWQVTLGDIAEPMVQAAKTLLSEEGFSCQTGLFPAEKIPYHDESFGLVTTRVAAHHFSSPAQFVHESKRVLKPGGHLLIIDGSVPNGPDELASWVNQIEKWRDPSHHRMLSQTEWQKLVEGAGLNVEVSRLEPFKQPDLEWYFETANTSTENRKKVLKSLHEAPTDYLKAIRFSQEGGKISWWWQRISLLGRKA